MSFTYMQNSSPSYPATFDSIHFNSPLSDSSVSSLIQAGWRQEKHLVTKNLFQHSHHPMNDRQLPYGD